jgi:hypothetical protein
MPSSNKKYRSFISSDGLEKSVLIGMFLVLLSILSVDLISRNFHIKHAGNMKRLDTTEQLQTP